VLLAQEGEKQRLVVLKLQPTIVADDEGTVEMFLDEGRIAARLCQALTLANTKTVVTMFGSSR
jgi:hypothetical protein